MKSVSAWILFAMSSGMLLPVAVYAQVFPLHRPGCCQSCTQPLSACQCARTRAVVQTHMRPEQVTTMKCVTETHVRKEAYTETVPVTKLETVTVDEGGYQMVWVPKPVTKQIAKTTYTQQLKTREIPYQVTRAVPQTVTRMVPYQTVQHVTEIVPTAVMMAPAPVIGCNTCATGTALVPHVHGAAFALTAPLPTTTLTPNPMPQTAQRPGQDFLGDWQSIPGKSAATPEKVERPVPMPTDEATQFAPPKTSGRFKAAPSAAVVWSAIGNGARSPAIATQNVARNDVR